MTPAAVVLPRSLLRHHPLGVSTGYMAEHRGDWQTLIAEAKAQSIFATELAALGDDELPALVEVLEQSQRLPFRYLSVHAPSKRIQLSERERVVMLVRLLPVVDAIVVHPDTIEDTDAYRLLADCLVLENMDARKERGRTAEELVACFEALPDARLCFDIAHAADVDPSMQEGAAILDRFADRLAHVHLSSLDDKGHHVVLRPEDEERFAPLLDRCRDVPWILEAPRE